MSAVSAVSAMWEALSFPPRGVKRALTVSAMWEALSSPPRGVKRALTDEVSAILDGSGYSFQTHTAGMCARVDQ